jgi:DNA-directed RNA polymerase subunit N (RpoN/RPB10)
MIIPIRCFTCGKVLADKWEYYQTEVEKLEKQAKENEEASQKIHKGIPQKFEKINTQKIMDDLGLERMCCRRHMLGHVDLTHII